MNQIITNYNEQAYRNLIASIFLLARKDLLHCNKCWRNDARKFLASRWAINLAELIDLSEKDIEKLEKVQ